MLTQTSIPASMRFHTWKADKDIPTTIKTSPRKRMLCRDSFLCHVIKYNLKNSFILRVAGAYDIFYTLKESYDSIPNTFSYKTNALYNISKRQQKKTQGCKN